MQLSNIAQFLEKYKKKLELEEDKRGVLSKIILEETGVMVDEKVLTITRGVIIIKSSHVMKNEIFLHKTQILKKIKEAGQTNIHDIQ